MKLIAKRRRLANEHGGTKGYGSRCHIETSTFFDPPSHLNRLTLESLAERWFKIFAPQQHVDSNKVICGDPEGWADLTLQDFVNRGYFVWNEDPTVVLAVEERIRRACVMVTLALAHLQLFHENEQVLDTEYRTPSSIPPVPLPFPVKE